MEERGPPRRLGQHHVANVQARLVGDDYSRVRFVDRRFMCGAGLFSKRPEVVAFALAESSYQAGLFRLFVVARGLALRPAIRGRRVDVDPGEAVGLRLC